MQKLSSRLNQIQFFLLNLLFLLTPFVFTWVNNELFEFNKMLTIYVFASTLVGLWIARMILEKRIIWKNNPLNWLILIFIIGQSLSFIFSIHPPSSWWGYSSRLNGGLLSSLAFVGIYFAALNAVSKQQAKQLFLTNVIALGLIALYAIPEHFGVSPSCLIINGEFGVECWKQDVQSRVFASFGQPNWLAAYLVTLSPLAWWLTFKSKTKTHRYIFGTISFLAFLALWYTKSKSGLLAFGASILFFTVLMGLKSLKKNNKNLKINKKILPSLIAVAIILTTFLSYKYLIKPTYEAGTYLGETNTSEASFDLSKGSSSADIRKIVWYGAWKVWQRYPVFGSGPATFAYSYYQDRPIAHNLVSEWDFIYNKAHNEFLNYLAETGLVGLTSYLIFAIGSIWLILTYKKDENNTKKNSILSIAVASGLVGMHVSNFFGFSTAMSNLLLFTLPPLQMVASSRFSSIKKSIKINQFNQYILLMGILFIWLFSLSSLGNYWLGDYYNTQGSNLISASEYTKGLEKQQKAIEISPKKAEYYESLANTYAKLALIYYYDEQPTVSQSLYEASLTNSDFALALNPQHLNLYKTKARVLLLLVEFDESNLLEAEKALGSAINLSPTDAKLWYNLGLTLSEQKKTNKAIMILEETISIKQDYVKAREKLGDLYLETGETEKAIEQYQFILENLSSANVEVRQKLESISDL